MIIYGNILDYINTHYIAHQCNCITQNAKGLAEVIYKKYPNANIYNDDTERMLGTIIVREKVINMIAQYTPGFPKSNNIKKQRENAFKQCLDEIVLMFPEGIPIAFPYLIGCGLAGGNWEIYKSMIETFAKTNSKFEIIIINNKK